MSLTQIPDFVQSYLQNKINALMRNGYINSFHITLEVSLKVGERIIGVDEIRGDVLDFQFFNDCHWLINKGKALT